MADGLYNEPRKWSLEEIDELLRDSGIVSDESESEKTKQFISKSESLFVFKEISDFPENSEKTIE